MSKRQFLEKMIENLIENDVESARANFHQFVVESARDIHSSLIESDELEDDLGDEDKDGETVEESFEVVSEDEGDIGAEIPGDMGGAEGDDFGGDEMGGEGEEIDPDHDGDNDAEGDHIEVEMTDYDDLKAQLAALQAKFDSLNPEAGEGEEAGEEGEGEGEEVEVPFHEEMGSEESHDDEMGHEMEEGFDLTEEDLLGLEESWTEVKVTMDGKEQGGGKFAGGEKNTKTPLATREKEEVLASKKDNHSGYEREKAPEAPMKSDSTNVMASGKKAWTEKTQHNTEDEIGDGEKFATPAKSKTTPVAKN